MKFSDILIKNYDIKISKINDFLNDVSYKLENLEDSFEDTIRLEIYIEEVDDYDYSNVDVKRHLIKKHSFPKDIEVTIELSYYENECAVYIIEIKDFN